MEKQENGFFLQKSVKDVMLLKKDVILKIVLVMQQNAYVLDV